MEILQGLHTRSKKEKELGLSPSIGDRDDRPIRAMPALLLVVGLAAANGLPLLLCLAGEQG